MEPSWSSGQTGDVPMRQDCKFFESRTYANGDTVRKCDLDLAPEAPWRCPDGCEAFQPRLADVNWAHGSAVTPPTPDAPEAEGIAELLDAAEDIVNAAGPGILADVEAEQRRKGEGGGWRRIFGRRR
jgi:hypothetical protein